MNWNEKRAIIKKLEWLRSKNVIIYEIVPHGWKVIKNAQNSPRGYRFISNGKSRFDKDYRIGLINEESLARSGTAPNDC